MQSTLRSPATAASAATAFTGSPRSRYSPDVSITLWVIAILLAALYGIQKLAQALGAGAAKGVEYLANPRFRTMGFAELPRWVGLRLTNLRDQFLALGFRELVNYTWESDHLNYTCVLVSPVGSSCAAVWVSRHYGLSRWMSVFLGWPALKRELLVAPRYGLITDLPGARRFETSPVEILAKSQVDGEVEFLTVPASMTLAQVIERHAAAARAFAARCGAKPILITTAEQLFDCERALSARIAKKIQRDLAGGTSGSAIG